MTAVTGNVCIRALLIAFDRPVPPEAWYHAGQNRHHGDAAKPLPSLFKDTHRAPQNVRRNQNFIFRRLCLGKGSSCRFEMANILMNLRAGYRDNMIEDAVGAPA